MTAGTLTLSGSAMADKVTDSYKWYEIESLCGGDAVGFSAFFRGGQQLPVKARAMAANAFGAALVETTRRPRGETVCGRSRR